MTTEDRRNEIINHYRSVRAELEEAMSGLSESQMTEPTLDGWSIKDHLAHLALWDDMRVQEIARVSAGMEPAWKMAGELDEVINDIAYGARKDWSLRQAMLEFQTSRQNLIDAIANATPRGLDESLYGNAPLRSGHDAQHADYIRRWRSRTATGTPSARQDLLEHYAANWAKLDDAIAGLSDAQMVEKTIDGWSVKDNLAHLAIWDDLRADEIARISAGFVTTLPMSEQQDHVYNEIAYELRKDLSLEQVRWEVQHSRQRLLQAIKAAPEEALEPSKYGEAGLRSSHGNLHAGYIREWRQRVGI
jgi:hypothetical protein